MSSLKKLAITATIWTLLGYGSSQVLRLGANLIITRLLLPEVFGLMSLVNTFIIGLNLFSDLGIVDSIVRHEKGEEKEFYNTAWTLQVIRGFVIWIGSIIMAYPVSIFYESSSLKLLIPVLGLTSFINGFQSTSLHFLTRHINEKKKIIFNLLVQILSLLIMIVLAWQIRNVWSLVIANIISSVISTIITHRLIPEVKNYFYWDKSALEELFGYGKWIFISTILTFLAMQTDRLLLGRLFTIELLGIYTIAFMFADLPVQIIDRLNSSVVFPVVSKMKDLPRITLKQKIINKRKFLFALAILLIALLSSFGDLLITILYDDRYKQAAWMLPILSIGIWPNLLGVTMRSVQIGIGKPMYGAYGYLFKFIYMIVLLPLIASQMGILGGIIVIAFNDIPFYIAVQYGLWRENLMTLKEDFIATILLFVTITIFITLRSVLGAGFPLSGIF
ncbi:oligosaccharide flippase family protein [Geminocystis sp. GBBB08]|uniref:oligosaccharide flippase family protein n=1 Tax=Geminocystis sp. GBBB08 TaxID=2604140 RepID=UPI0027E23065|nr:oligosaccharide flippase family protein [Geminocystis sp. GBBB08]MBL1211612.1 oligosaccharide flippase family protein [Geminocystis sp. GBBB08]